MERIKSEEEAVVGSDQNIVLAAPPPQACYKTTLVGKNYHRSKVGDNTLLALIPCVWGNFSQYSINDEMTDWLRVFPGSVE